MAEGGTVNNIVLFGLDGDSVRLNQKLSTTPKLVYYFSSNGCPGCFEPVLFRLDSLGKKIGYENIIILAKFSNTRGLKVYWEDKPQQIPIYRVSENPGLFYSNLDYEYAYSFLLSNNGIARKFIVTDKSNTLFIENYFGLIFEYFQNIKFPIHQKTAL